MSEVVAALSYALDVTDGHDLAHAVRTCVIGMRLADEVGLEVEARSALFYGLLLKDAGCSSNAAKVAALYGADDHRVKRNVGRANSSPTALNSPATAGTMAFVAPGSASSSARDSSLSLRPAARSSAG